MEKWAEKWLILARKYFPDNKIYLVAGGDGHPALGANFSRQVKLAAKYGAGVRITNQKDSYRASFIRTLQVATASNFYKTYFTTEEAGINSKNGIIARVYDMIASNASGAYFKSIIHAKTGCEAYANYESGIPLGEFNIAPEEIRSALSFARGKQPFKKAAVIFPTTSITIDPRIIWPIYTLAGELRNYLDFDLIDEQLICDGALSNYKTIINFFGEIFDDLAFQKIRIWLNDKNQLISTLIPKNLSGEKITNIIKIKKDPIKELLQIIFPEGRPEIIKNLFKTEFDSEVIYLNDNPDIVKLHSLSFEPFSIKIKNFKT